MWMLRSRQFEAGCDRAGRPGEEGWAEEERERKGDETEEGPAVVVVVAKGKLNNILINCLQRKH